MWKFCFFHFLALIVTNLKKYFIEKYSWTYLWFQTTTLLMLLLLKNNKKKCFKLLTFGVFGLFFITIGLNICLLNMAILIKYKNSQLLVPLCTFRLSILKFKNIFWMGKIWDFELLNFTKLVKKSHCAPLEKRKKSADAQGQKRFAFTI